MLRKLPGRSAHAVTRLLRGHRHSSRTSLHQYVQKIQFTFSLKSRHSIHHCLTMHCVYWWGNQEDKEQETHCACVQSEPVHVCLV